MFVTRNLPRLCLMCLVMTCATMASGRGLDEVNFWRSRNGLRPLREDPLLTRFAQRKAVYRAARMLKNGHQGEACPADCREGTGEAQPQWGWLTCVMEEDATHGGAGVAIGEDGERYMVLVVRGGSGSAPRGRNVRPLATAHLTPDAPVVQRLR
jgi:hypothetical protein